MSLTPERQIIVNGRKIEEFWWGRKFIVYIDNKLSELNFEQAIKLCNKNK